MNENHFTIQSFYDVLSHEYRLVAFNGTVSHQLLQTSKNPSLQKLYQNMLTNEKHGIPSFLPRSKGGNIPALSQVASGEKVAFLNSVTMGYANKENHLMEEQGIMKVKLKDSIKSMGNGITFPIGSDLKVS